MLCKDFLQLIFSGSSMRRWNDKLRPIELYEIDKQGHKSIIAWMLTILNSKDMSLEEQIKLQQQVIEQLLFDYLFGLIITDITPQVFCKICENPEHKKKLTDWVITKLQPTVEPVNKGFWQRFITYHYQTLDSPTLSNKIIMAARLYASGWEFAIIQPYNFFDEETEAIANSFTKRLSNIKDVIGVSDLIQDNKFFSENPTVIGRFARLCGQLRFQIRWSGVSRIPETSVLGHMFLVATYVYFCSLIVGGCTVRCINNFFAGLFHDLPEILTRDIITPVKYSVDLLPKLLKEYELQELEQRIFGPLLNAGYMDLATKLQYYLGYLNPDNVSEFQETIQNHLGVQVFNNFEELHKYGNNNRDNPKDGQLLKACDRLVAFMEAHTSISKGISESEFNKAINDIKTHFKGVNFGPISFEALVEAFG